MITLVAAIAILVPISGAPQDPREVDTLRALARAGSDSALVSRARRQADGSREALRLLLAGTVGASDSGQAASLAAADRLAAAIAVAWRDSFPVHQVARFRSLSPRNRLVTVQADSVLRAGHDALKSAGVAAAMRAWRESLRLYQGLADSWGIARALNGIGRGFRNAHELDSAEAYLTRSRDLAERIGDYNTLGHVLTQQGDIQEKRGDFGRAAELLAEARVSLERTGNTAGLAANQNVVAIIAARRGDLAGSRRAFEAALAGFRSSGDRSSAAMALNNLGTLALQRNDYAEAASRYGEALAIARELGNQADVAGVLRNLGVLATRRGDYPAALTAFSEAVAIVHRTGPESHEVKFRKDLADAHADMGDLQSARAELERAEALATRRGEGGASLGDLGLARGHLAFRFNQLAEAERQYASAERLARDDPHDEFHVWNRAQLGMAQVLLRRGSYRRAQESLERLLARGDFDPHNAAQIRITMGEAAWRGGDTATARRALRTAIDTLHSIGAVDNEAEALAALGALELNAGRALAAESLYQRGLTRLGARPAPDIAWELHAGLAGTLWSRGALPGAEAELLSAIAEIERLSGNLPVEEHRAAFRANKWNVYAELALVERARGKPQAAFETSERLRARQMLDLLARGRPATPGASGGTLSSREQDLRRKIVMLTRQVESPADGSGLRDPAVETANAAASDALAQAQDEYGELLLEMRAANPAYAALVRGEIASAPDVMRALAPDEALVEYLVGDSTTIVFVVTSDSLVALDLKVSHSVLTAEVDFARTTLARPRESDARQAWQPSLRRLYRRLFAPVEASGLLAGKNRLIIAPHAELHYLPFSALVGAGPPEQLLIERYLVDYVPSASVWLRLRDRSRPTQQGGILALAPRARALPGSRAEVSAIRRIYGDRAHMLVGNPATERAFRTLAPQQEIVHLATFGVLNKHNPLFSYVELGKAPGEDGRLEVHEVFGLSLNARLLVLSACQTGLAAGALSDVPPGDDWVGLVQGFLYAGAGNVVATLWPVADRETAGLMERFYQELATGGSETEALAQAQRAALGDPRTAHPFYWAGFTLVRGR